MATIDKSEIQVRGAVHDSSQSHVVISENVQLLHQESYEHRLCCSHLKLKFKRIVCLRSKPVILLLIWSFITSVLQWNYDPYSVIIIFGFFFSISSDNKFDFLKVIVCVYAFFAVFQLVYPLAGLLADI